VIHRRYGTEAQGIEHGDGPRAHGENVAQNSSHAGSRALEGLHVAGVIVRFHFEDGGQAVADVDDTGIFTGPLQDLRRARGEALEMNAAGFVGTMLAPHDAENTELGEIGFPAQNLLDAGVLLGSDAVLGDERERHRNFGGERGGCAGRVRQASAHGGGRLPRERLHQRAENDKAVG
jgi:hypothetical protein